MLRELQKKGLILSCLIVLPGKPTSTCSEDNIALIYVINAKHNSGFCTKMQQRIDKTNKWDYRNTLQNSYIIVAQLHKCIK